MLKINFISQFNQFSLVNPPSMTFGFSKSSLFRMLLVNAMTRKLLAAFRWVIGSFGLKIQKLLDSLWSRYACMCMCAYRCKHSHIHTYLLVGILPCYQPLISQLLWFLFLVFLMYRKRKLSFILELSSITKIHVLLPRKIHRFTQTYQVSMTWRHTHTYKTC